MNKKLILIISFLSFVFSGCATSSSVKKGDYYKSYFNTHPTSILVLPARNTTTAADAAEHFRYSITQPLAERGYYVYPVHLVDAFFKSENIVENELIRNIPISKLKEVFNADAIVYIDINAWDTGYNVISSNVDVGLSYAIVNTATEKEIWRSNAYAYSARVIDTSSIVSIIVSAVTVAVNTGTDYTKLSLVANQHGLSTLPVGKYHPNYKSDLEEVLVIPDSGEYKNGLLYVDEYFVYGENSEEDVPLVVRMRANGYFAFNVMSLGGNVFKHNGYTKYYYLEKVGEKTYLKNKFFLYDDYRPFLFVEGKKLYVERESDGKIPFIKDGSKYYFNIEEVVEVKSN